MRKEQHKSLYRYTSKKYNDGLTALGNLRIGTLHDFRKQEHKAGIADANEGTKTVSHHIDSWITGDTSWQSQRHARATRDIGAIDMDPGVRGVLMNNVNMVGQFNHPDCFIHCTSYRKGIEVMREFEDADSCVEIHNPKAFYQRLTQSISRHIPVKLAGVFYVQYKSREEIWDGHNHLPPSVIKEPSFSPQYEVRAIWLPRFSGAIQPFNLNDTHLTSYCQKVKF